MSEGYVDIQHWSDCAVHNEPYSEAGPCDCGGVKSDEVVKMQRPEPAIVIHRTPEGWGGD